MGEQCWLCKAEISWGTPVCPQCGSALEWTEGDDDDHLASLMPPGWDDGEAESEWRRRRVKPYTVVAVLMGLALVIIGAAAGMRWGMIVPGVLVLGVGIYSMVTLAGRYG